MIITLLLFNLNFVHAAATQEPAEEPLWEYGIGVGGIRYYHYPAADQSRDVGALFPTFQYRGEILRADDRDGARAYLLRHDDFSLEMGGGILPAVSADDNEARKGMDAIPWGVQLGPQLVIKPDDDWEIKIGAYQAITTDFKLTRATGFLSEAEFLWTLDRFLTSSIFYSADNVTGRFGFQAEVATSEFLRTYYEIGESDVTPTRPAYTARGGFLSYGFSYLQKMTWGRTTFYMGLSDKHYDLSANRQSPLHRQNENLGVFLGMTYSLKESKKVSVPEEKARGLLERR